MKEQETDVREQTAAATDTLTEEPKEENAAEETAEKPLTLEEVIEQNTTEEDQPAASGITLREILGGDILNTEIIKRQIWLLTIIAGFMFVYISNRYSCQKYLIEIEKLETELKDVKYRSLISSGQLTEISRESNVLEMLFNNNDSTLHLSNQPPYIINVPEK